MPEPRPVGRIVSGIQDHAVLCFPQPAPAEGLARRLEAVCRLPAILEGNPSPRLAMVSERAEQCDPADDVFVRNHFVQQGIFRRLKQQIVTVAECGDLRRSASPSDSFRLRDSTSIVRKCPTRSGQTAGPCLLGLLQLNSFGGWCCRCRRSSSQGLGGSFDISSGQIVSTAALTSSVTLWRTGVSTT
jgi:hypothetical protein